MRSLLKRLAGNTARIFETIFKKKHATTNKCLNASEFLQDDDTQIGKY